MPYADDDWDEPEDAFDGPDDDGPDTDTCRYCGAEIYDDSVRCPHCEKYLSEEDAPPRRHPWWIALGVLAVLAITAMWVFGGM